MSWDIFPKDKVEYFLEKLKGKFDNKADNSDVTEADTQNSTPFLYRETPYEADRVFLDELVGGSVVVNQLVNPSNYEVVSTNGITWTKNNEKVTATGSVDSYNAVYKFINLEKIVYNHIYFLCGCPKNGSNSSYYIRFTGPNNYYEYGNGLIFRNENQASSSEYLRAYISSGYSISGSIEFKPQLIDLTQMFGTTIADYIYSLEQTTAGSGIAWLKSHGFFTKDYYPYNAGELISVKTSGKKYVGKNVLDYSKYEENGTFCVFGSTLNSNDPNGNVVVPAGTWTFSVSSVVELISVRKSASEELVRLTNVSSAIFTVTETTAIKLSIKQTNFVYSNYTYQLEKGSTATPYEPHTETTYDISNIDLRGIPKLVNNELVYDGDTYDSNGDVTRKYGIVDLGSLSWSYSSASGHQRMMSNGISNLVFPNTDPDNTPKIVCKEYIADSPNGVYTHIKDKIITVDQAQIQIWDSSYTDAAAFKTAMSGVYLIYELATSSTETADPYTNPQICDKDGTEEWIDDRTVPIPVGHNSRYADLPAIMDGDYLSYMAKNFASEDYVDTELDTKVDKVTGKGLSTNDYTNDEKALVATIPNKADSDDVASTQTASGNPITLTDASETYAESLVVELEPIQDLHGYDFPWVGGAGKNKLHMSDKTFSGTDAYFSEWIYNSGIDNAVELQAGVTYTLSFDITCSNLPCYVSVGAGNGYYSFDIAQVAITENGRAHITFTPTNEYLQYGNILAFRAPRYGSLATYSGTLKNIMLEVSSSPTAFAPWENKSPLSGYEGVEVEDVGKNFCGELEIGTFAESSQIGSTYDEMKIANGARIRSKGLIPTFNNDIVISCDFANYQYCFCLYDADKKYLGEIDGFGSWKSAPYTPVTPSSFIAIALKRNDGAIITNDGLENCHLQVEKGTTATPYKPFISRTASVTFGQTVYGGTVDFLTGKVLVNKAKDILKNLTKNNFTNGVYSTCYRAVLSSVSTAVQASQIHGAISSYLTENNAYWGTSRTGEDGSGTYAPFFAINTPGEIVAVYDKSTSISESDFLSKYGDMEICYPLANPFEIQLTPAELKLLQDTNNITTNGTTITLDYIPNNSIGDAVKASEEYTDRAVEGKADNTTAYVDLPGNYDTTNKNFPTRSATSGSVENCLTYINDLADKLYTAINSHATALANIPTKTVVVNHRAIDVGDEFNISLPLSYKFLIIELTIILTDELCYGSIVSTDFANGSVLSIVANGHGLSYWCDLSRIANTITVDGNFDSAHGELTITAF